MFHVNNVVLKNNISERKIMTKKLTSYQPYGLAVVRIVVAYLFILHGSSKLFSFPVDMGGALPPLMVFAGILEFFGGLLLLVGWFTRPTAFVLSGQMAFAYFLGHAIPAGSTLLPLINKGEPAVLFCFIFLYLVFAGAGAWSIDTYKQAAR